MGVFVGAFVGAFVEYFVGVFVGALVFVTWSSSDNVGVVSRDSWFLSLGLPGDVLGLGVRFATVITLVPKDVASGAAA